MGAQPISATEVRRSEVREAIDIMASRIDSVENLSNALRDRLAGVLREEPPRPEAEKSPELPHYVPIANEIQNLAERLTSANTVLEGLLNRLEL